jgi:hypothetical protein
MRDPNKNIIDIDTGTLVLMVFAFIVVPLILAGFFFQ